MNNNKTDKTPLGYFTQNATAQILNRDRGTIRKIITENTVRSSKIGRYEYYKMSDVVNSMMEGDRLDLQQERAKLAKKQTEKAGLQIKQMESILIDREEVKESWTKYVSSCRAKLLALPSKMASQVLAADSLQEVQEIIKSHIYEALTELATD